MVDGWWVYVHLIGVAGEVACPEAAVGGLAYHAEEVGVVGRESVIYEEACDASGHGGENADAHVLL